MGRRMGARLTLLLLLRVLVMARGVGIGVLFSLIAIGVVVVVRGWLLDVAVTTAVDVVPSVMVVVMGDGVVVRLQYFPCRGIFHLFGGVDEGLFAVRLYSLSAINFKFRARASFNSASLLWGRCA